MTLQFGDEVLLALFNSGQDKWINFTYLCSWVIWVPLDKSDKIDRSMLWFSNVVVFIWSVRGGFWWTRGHVRLTNSLYSCLPSLNVSELANELFSAGMNISSLCYPVLPFSLKQKSGLSWCTQIDESTHWLRQIGVCCSVHPDWSCVVTQGVELVKTEIEGFCFACGGFSGYCMVSLFTSSSFTTLTSLSFTLELFGRECRACLHLKSAHWIS